MLNWGIWNVKSLIKVLQHALFCHVCDRSLCNISSEEGGGWGVGGEELGPLFPNFLDPPWYLKSVKIARRYPSGTSTSKFWKSYSRQYFIVTLDENPHFTKSGSILKQVWIIFLEKVLDIYSFCHFVKLSNFKCLVCHVSTLRWKRR